MDIQGAELKALKGLGEKIQNIKIFHLEVEFIEIYYNQPLFNSINRYLIEKNFQLLGFSARTNFSGDVIYVNKRYFNNDQIAIAQSIFSNNYKDFKFYVSTLFFKFKYVLFKIKKSIFFKTN